MRENGTTGTDHGTESAIFLAGGAIKGGHILGQWPGLKPEQLFENRDLMSTSSKFSWIATALSQHGQLSTTQLIESYYESENIQYHLDQNLNYG